jgi:hypothetical protein
MFVFKKVVSRDVAALLVVFGMNGCNVVPVKPITPAPPPVTSPAPPPPATPTPPSPPPPPPPSIVYSSPIVISKGGTYSGNWQSLDADVAAVDVRTAEPVVITNSNIRSLGSAIRSFQADAQITVQNVRAEAVYPTALLATKAEFVNIGLFKSVRVEHNDVTGYATGVRLLNFGPDVTRSGQTIRVQFNRFKNIDGRRSDGNGGYLLEHKANGQAIGLNTIRQAKVEIAWNEIINLPFQSETEDTISTYESGGTADTPILIHDNYIQGNYATDPAAAIEFSGTGINLGDSPSNHPDVGYTNAYDNQVVSFENSGIGVSSGHHQRIWNNRVVSAANAPDGTLLGSVWRSAYGFWNYYNSPYWANNALYDNVYAVADKNSNKAPPYTPSATPESVYNNTELFDRLPTTADEQAEFQRWQQKVKDSGITLGVVSQK